MSESPAQSKSSCPVRILAPKAPKGSPRSCSLASRSRVERRSVAWLFSTASLPSRGRFSPLCCASTRARRGTPLTRHVGPDSSSPLCQTPPLQSCQVESGRPARMRVCVSALSQPSRTAERWPSRSVASRTSVLSRLTASPVHPGQPANTGDDSSTSSRAAPSPSAPLLLPKKPLYPRRNPCHPV